MPRTCTICTHANKDEIDKALIDNATVRDIARRHSVSKDAVHRHKQSHLPRALVQASQAAEVVHGDNLLNQMRDLNARTLTILARAEHTGELRTALAAIGEVRRNLELLARLMGELEQKAPQVTTNILVQQLRTEHPRIVRFVAMTGRYPTDVERRDVMGELAVTQGQ